MDPRKKNNIFDTIIICIDTTVMLCMKFVYFNLYVNVCHYTL